MSRRTLTSLVVCSSLALIAALAVSSPVRAEPAAPAEGTHMTEAHRMENVRMGKDSMAQCPMMKDVNETQEGITAMVESKSETNDPVCGMTVDESPALGAKRGGRTLYFCSDHCPQAFVSAAAGCCC